MQGIAWLPSLTLLLVWHTNLVAGQTCAQAFAGIHGSENQNAEDAAKAVNAGPISPSLFTGQAKINCCAIPNCRTFVEVGSSAQCANGPFREGSSETGSVIFPDGPVSCAGVPPPPPLEVSCETAAGGIQGSENQASEDAAQATGGDDRLIRPSTFTGQAQTDCCADRNCRLFAEVFSSPQCAYTPMHEGSSDTGRLIFPEGAVSCSPPPAPPPPAPASGH